jgi:hypothetical protein
LLLISYAFLAAASYGIETSIVSSSSSAVAAVSCFDFTSLIAAASYFTLNSGYAIDLLLISYAFLAAASYGIET